MMVEIKGDEAGIPGPLKGIDGDIGDIIEAHPMRDDQIDRLGEHIGGGHQFHLREDQTAAEIADHTDDFRQEHQEQDFPGNLFLFREGIEDGVPAEQEIENHHAEKNMMHGTVFLDQRGMTVFTDKGDAGVKEAVPALGEAGQKNGRAQGEEGSPDPAVHMNVAEAENGQHDHQLQKAAADVGKLVRHERFLKAPGPGVKEKTEIDNRHQDKEERDMDIVVPVPDEHVKPAQNDGDNERGEIIRVDHGDFVPSHEKSSLREAL